MRLEDLTTELSTVEIILDAKSVDLDIAGLELSDVAGLLVRFPDLRSAVEGGGIDLASIIQDVVPDAVPIIISTACGTPGKKGEAKARSIGGHNQLKVLRKVVSLTFPEGLEAFMAEIEALAPADLQTEAAPVNFALADPDVPDVMPVSMLNL